MSEWYAVGIIAQCSYLNKSAGKAEADGVPGKEAGRGAGLRPGTPTTSMTWALHLDKSCRPRRARSKSSRYSSSDFWLSSPEPVTTWRTRGVTLTDTFIPYLTQKTPLERCYY